MKKLVLVLFVAFTALFSFGQTTIGHVNTQKVLDTMPSRKAAERELKDFENRAVKELQETQQQLQADYQTLQQKQNTMNPTAFKFEEDRLMKKSQEFQTRQQELDQQIQILSQDLNAPILDMVQKAVKIVCDREKIQYVIDESSLLYSNGRDLTKLVIIEVLKLDNNDASINNNTTNGMGQ